MAIRTTTRPARTGTVTTRPRKRDDTRLTLLFILPALVGFLVFMARTRSRRRTPACGSRSPSTGGTTTGPS